jgi:hypothetical protein
MQQEVVLILRILLGTWFGMLSSFTLGSTVEGNLHTPHRMQDLEERIQGKTPYKLREEACSHCEDCDSSKEDKENDVEYFPPQWKRQSRPSFRTSVKQKLTEEQHTPKKYHIVCFRCAEPVSPTKGAIHIDHFSKVWRERKKDLEESPQYQAMSLEKRRAALLESYNEFPLRKVHAHCNLTRSKTEETPEKIIQGQIHRARMARAALFSPKPFPSI